MTLHDGEMRLAAILDNRYIILKQLLLRWQHHQRLFLAISRGADKLGDLLVGLIGGDRKAEQRVGNLVRGCLGADCVISAEEQHRFTLIGVGHGSPQKTAGAC